MIWNESTEIQVHAIFHSAQSKEIVLITCSSGYWTIESFPERFLLSDWPAEALSDCR